MRNIIKFYIKYNLNGLNVMYILENIYFQKRFYILYFNLLFFYFVHIEFK